MYKIIIVIAFILSFIGAQNIWSGEPEMINATVRVKIRNDYNDENTKYGSGVIINTDENKALILTAAHLFDGVDLGRTFCSVEIFKNEKNWTKIVDIRRADIIYNNIKTDVAFLEMKNDDFIAIKLADTFPVKTSDTQYVSVGCPYGLFPNIRRAEIICVNDNDSLAGLNHNEWSSYKTNIFAELGRSGGPLYNEDEKVIGILSYRVSGKYPYSVFIGGKTIKEELLKTNWGGR